MAGEQPGTPASDKSPLPSPTLPKGGGAIRDIGEKLSANSATGACSFSVPVFTSAGRDGFHPDLKLEYDSQKGNGPFGIGWSMSVPRLTRRTDKGLPRYVDGAESDTFILSGAEDLVPALTATGARDQLTTPDGFTVLRYRPRVEDQYARIERWTRNSGEEYWRAITRDNITSVYGRSASARISDPSNPNRIFSWLLEETRDGKGNIVSYEYKAEDQENIDRSIGLERTRPIANTYLKRIYYGNESPTEASSWRFQVLFDYGEHDVADPVNGPVAVWPARPDAFSDFRATFETRTYRLCRRVLMLHDFAELGQGWTVVRSTELAYELNPISTYLRSTTQTGWLRNPSGTYTTKALPSIELDYSRSTIEPVLHTVDPDSLADVPAGIDGKRYQLLDLDSEGLPGILTEQAGQLYYKRNDGEGHFAAAAHIGPKPSTTNLGIQQFADVDGSGEKFLVQLGAKPQGFFERRGATWKDFHLFQSIPNLDWNDGELKYLDLDGDGLPDILKPEGRLSGRSEGDLFRWWGSLGRDGYGAERRVQQPRDDGKGPYVVWTDRRSAVLIADMSGDGLPDIVRVRNGSVDYWPNLGYGRFGARVAMRDAPRFTRDDGFNPAFLRLADIDGSGTADLVYLERDAARIWMNQSGNGYGAEQRVPFPSPADTSVAVSDFLGKGTACLVWSSPLPQHRGAQIRYVDLMSGTKPHLLTSIRNNLGATTTIQYRSSTEDYLEDRKAGRPWVTKLPFPVQVVARLQVDESVTGTRLVTTYRYHHGHYDGREREFAGFGMVEKDDAETLQVGTGPAEEYTPPQRTKTWFHTGAFLDAQKISTQYAHEYDADFAQLVPDSLLPSPETPEESREAARALRGHLLRQEVYGLDGSALTAHPYAVLENNFEVRRLQPRANNRYGVFCVHSRETIAAHVERNPADARLEHELTLSVDDFGNVLESVKLAYPRKNPIAMAQGRVLATYAQRDFVTLTSGIDYYRVDLLRESRTYELSGLPALPADGVYARSDVLSFLAAATDIDFSVTSPSATPARRLFERTRHAFVGDQPADDSLVALGLVVEVQRAALTAALVSTVYGSLAPDPAQLLKNAKYIGDSNGIWWASGGQTAYVAAQFYLPQQHTDPFGNVSSVIYDAYRLLPIAATTAAGTAYQTTVTVENDYRVVCPTLIVDSNGNRTAAAFDPLGRVTATWVMGKSTEQIGDDLAHPSTRLEYHLEAVPAFVYTEKREEHFLTDPTNDKLQRAYAYSDGLGRTVLTKQQAEPDASGNARWIGSGRTVFDNKGNPVKKYEPYFSAKPDYEAVIAGVSDLIHYDPLGRVARTDHPNGSYSRVELDAWTQTSFDENDTVGEPGNLWYAAYSNGTKEQKDAAAKALAHWGTPTRAHFDALGRAFLTEVDNGKTGNPVLLPTTFELDIQGNQRTVNDARQVDVATHSFDMLGRALFAHSVDAGDSTRLFDALGAVVHEWNPNHVEIEREYDPIRRQRRLFVTQNGQRRLAERTFYGETLADGAAHNLRGRVFRQLDGAGLVTNEKFDFKGNALSTDRRLASVYDQTSQSIGWPDLADPAATTTPPAIPGVEGESFPTVTAYDALNRIKEVKVPSSSAATDTDSYLPTYNEAGLLETIGVRFRSSAATTVFVSDIDYNERGQRLKIIFGNGIATTYAYEPETFRLSTLSTTNGLQALAYTYDPVGNITTITDAAQETLFVGNSKISPTTKYTYDAIYRLVNALGREHGGQAVPEQTETPLGVPFPSPNDPQAMRLYAETYQYDDVGNFLQMAHAVTNAQGQFQNLWTRLYTPDAQSNRLLKTVNGNATTAYSHDGAGNITAMASAPLPTLTWDHRNQLIHTTSSKGESHYTYDASGQRVRKVLVNGNTIKERVYLGVYEVYRQRTGNTIALERRTLHVNDDRRSVALVETRTVGSDGSPAQLVRYQLDNHIGSAVLELDDSASLLSYEEFHPYGSTAYRATASVLDSNPKRYAFTAKERDGETGLYYYGARYYAPWLGRWTSADPGGLGDGPNLYRYAKDNPVVLVDPDGRVVEPAVGGGPAPPNPAVFSTPPTPPPTTAPPPTGWSPPPTVTTGAGAATEAGAAGVETTAAGVGTGTATGTGVSGTTAVESGLAAVGGWIIVGVLIVVSGYISYRVTKSAIANLPTPEPTDMGAPPPMGTNDQPLDAPPAPGAGPVVLPGPTGARQLEVPGSSTPAQPASVPGAQPAVPSTLPGSGPATPLRASEEQPRATSLPTILPGTKEWKAAVAKIREGGKTKSNFRVLTATDAKRLLKEARGNLDRYKRYSSKQYKKGYEVHPNESHTLRAPHNDLPHLKWRDYASKTQQTGAGHIFFNRPN